MKHKILYIDDSERDAKPFLKSLNEAGYEVHFFKNHENAMKNLFISEYIAVILDCLLPKISGFKVAELIQKECPETLPVIFISGIYGEETYAPYKKKDYTLGFLKKPFTIEHLLSLVKKAEEKSNPEKEIDNKTGEVKEKSLTALGFNSKTLMEEEKFLKILNKENPKTIHDMEIPFVFYACERLKLSGVLHLQNQKGEKIGSCHINEGLLYQISLEDTFKSMFIELAVSQGFVKREDLEKWNHKEEDNCLNPGETLVRNNLMSPHSVNLVLREQILIRMSQIFQGVQTQIYFMKNTDLKGEKLKVVDLDLEQQELKVYYLEYILSQKISLEQLESFFSGKLNYSLTVGSDWDSLFIYKNINFLKRFCEQVEKTKLPIPFYKLTHKIEDAKKFLLPIYGLLSVGVLGLEEIKTENFSQEEKRLQNIYISLTRKKAHEIFGLHSKAQLSSVKESYQQLSQSFHPDRIPKDSPPSIVKIYKNIFNVINESYRSIKVSSKDGGIYDKNQEVVALKEILEMDNFIAGCKDLLNKGQFQRVLEIAKVFQEKTQKPPSEYLVYIIWAKLGLYSADNRKYSKLVIEASNEIEKIPYEEKQSADCLYVQGLLYKSQKQYRRALYLFKKAREINPSHRGASIEIENSENKNEKQNTSTLNLTQILDQDLGTMMKKILNKKSS